MAIDITNKEEKQIALTGVEIEETLLQAHLSKDAIAKIEGLEASASEIEGKCTFNENTLTLVGDSIAALEWKLNYARGCVTWGIALLGQRMTFIDNFGIPGERTDQILARISDTIETKAKYICFIMGKNDIIQGKAYEDIIQNMYEIISQTVRAGKVAIMTTIIPSTSDTEIQRNLTVKLNRWIINQSGNIKNYIVVDFYDGIVDNLTGMAKSGYLLDGIHPTAKGGFSGGLKFYNTLNNMVLTVPIFQNSNLTDGVQIVSNSLFLNGTTVAAGWANTGTASLSKEITESGYCQVLTSTDITANVFKQSIYNGFVDGDTINGFCDIEVTDVIELKNITIQVTSLNASNATISNEYALFLETSYSFPNQNFRATFKVPSFVIPIGTVRILPVITTKVNGKVKIHKVQLFNNGQ